MCASVRICIYVCTYSCDILVGGSSVVKAGGKNRGHVYVCEYVYMCIQMSVHIYVTHLLGGVVWSRQVARARTSEFLCICVRVYVYVSLSAHIHVTYLLGGVVWSRQVARSEEIPTCLPRCSRIFTCVCVTWLFHMRHVHHSYVTHTSFISVWRGSDPNTPSQMLKNLHLCVCDMTYSYLTRESFMWRMPHSYVCDVTQILKRLPRCSRMFTCVCVIWLIHQ